MFGFWCRALPSAALAALLAVSGTGCVKEPVALRPAHAGVAPALAVERFLNAANANDLDTMARLFGTRDGSVLKRGKRSEVETRMFALASILRHKNYTLEREGIVPGRTGEAIQLVVRMDFGDREVTVPFVLVQTRKDGWLVEQVAIERITGQG